MQFITTGNRIAVENFTIGDLYTITFTNGDYINSACIGIGGNFVTFQRNEPELLFSLTMETAELVSTIDLYAGGTGTTNYNELKNKAQINSVELVGNKSLAALGIQPEITEESPLSSALVSGLGSAAEADTSDFATAAQGALAASAVQPADMTAALALKQDTLSFAQLEAVNSGITSADVSQITTNKNNISSIQDIVSGKALSYTPNSYIETGDVGTTISLTPTGSGNWCHILITDPPIGMVYKITSTGGTNPRAWSFIDVDLKVISTAASDATVTDYLLKVPSNAKYMIINSRYANPYSAQTASILDRLNASTF